MAKTIGSFDLASLKNLRDDVTQYFWFESNSSSAWGSGAHVTLYPESQFTDSTSPNYMKGQNIIMNTDGFSIRNGALPMMVLDNNSLDFNAVDTSSGTYTTMATFGLNGAQIGQSGGAHTVIDEDGMQIYSVDSSDNLVQLANIGYGAGTDSGGGTSNAPYYTLGTRYTGSTVGNYSVAEGTITIASGYASHAEGENTTASGASSHAEGYVTTASKTGAHTEGMITTASGISSHAEGTSTKATGNNSHAQNYGTIASSSNQTALGKYNISDSANTYAVIIGNGTADNARSNALTVDWDGNVDAIGSIISDANYEDAWHDSNATQGYIVFGLSLAGDTYLGQAIRLEKVSATNKHPIFNGFDITGTGTARIHTLGHYIYKDTYNGEQYWYAYIKMRNDNTSAISNFSVTAYIAWI